MTARPFEPFAGLTVIQLDNGVGSRRSWTVSVTDVVPDTATNDQPDWEGVAGGSLTLRYETDSVGATPPGAETSVLVEVRLFGGAQIGTTDWIPTASGQTQTFHFDNDPLDQAGGPARAGTVEIYLRVTRNVAVTYDLDSRGTVSTPPATFTHEWARGYLRAPNVLVSHSVSNVALAGAEPATFAYPDPIHIRATVQYVWFEAVQMRMLIWDPEEAEGVYVRNKLGSATVGPNHDASFTSNTEVVNSTFDIGSDHLRFELEDVPISGVEEDNRFVWAASGHEAGWTLAGQILTKNNRLPVDPTVTLSNLTITTASTTTASIMNRGEQFSGTVEITNARSEGFAVRSSGAHRLRFYDNIDAAVETVHTTPTPSASGTPPAVVTLTWTNYAFSTTSSLSAGNRATESLQRNPADAGAAKKLQWDDTLGNSPLASTGQVCLLSQSYEVRRHLQLNDNDPIDTAETESHIGRLASDLGFFTVQLRDRRTLAVASATLVGSTRIAIQDDGSLVSRVESSVIALTSSGGYVGPAGAVNPADFLTAWSSSLPAGGWDLWVTDGAAGNGTITHNGNKGVANRQGIGTSDLVLLTVNPKYQLIASVGCTNANRHGHLHQGDGLIIGLAVFDTETGDLLPGDGGAWTAGATGGTWSGGTIADLKVSAPRAIISRFNSATGQAQYLTSTVDGAGAYSWVNINGADPMSDGEWRCSEAVPGSRAFTRSFTAAQTEGWESYDLLLIGRCEINATPYSRTGHLEVVQANNSHEGYTLDALGLALSGVLSQK